MAGVDQMPKFKITTDAGHGPETSDEPLHFPDKKAAIDDAQIAVAEMAAVGKIQARWSM